MLVLHRKIGQCIIIGDNIVIKYLRRKSNQIVLGIDAPHDLIVDREEIFLKRKKESVVRNDN